MIDRECGHYDVAVAYDEAAAEQIRKLLARKRGITEKKMFGGLAFLVNGNMAVAASGQGGLLVRVDPAESDALVASTKATPMEMRGRRWQAGCKSRPATTYPSGSSAVSRTRSRCRRSRCVRQHESVMDPTRSRNGDVG